MGTYEVTPVRASFRFRSRSCLAYCAMSSATVEKLKPNAPFSWHSMKPGATMRPPRSTVSSGMACAS